MARKGAALEFLEKEFQGPVQDDEEVVAITTSVGEAIRGDPDRLMITFVNLGANVIILSTLPNPSSTRGYYLAANGGSISMTVRDDGTLPTRQFFAIALVGASTLQISLAKRLRLGNTPV